MTRTLPRLPRHGLGAAVASISTVLDEAAQAPVWSLSPEEAGDVLVALTQVVARTTELQLRVVAHADAVGAGDRSGATSTANWWAHETGLTRAETHRLTKLATALDTQRHAPVREALAAGGLNLDQAQVIVTGIEALPDDLVDDALRREAENKLLELADDWDATRLRVFAKRILDVVAPEVGEAHEARTLAAEEEAARTAAAFRMTDDGHGQTHGRFTIPTRHAAMLRKALLGLAAPKHRAAIGETTGGERSPSPQRMGQAFCEYIERYPTDRLPDAGGVAATVVVTIPIDTLTGGPAPGQLDTGERLSPGQARRWACEAGIIPVVLGGASQVLDLGRTRRFHTKAQRTALGLEQGGCTTEGEDWPPGLCHVHHTTPWHRGGPTNTTDARLLCPRHHARAHDPTYQTTHSANGKVSFHRRT